MEKLGFNCFQLKQKAFTLIEILIVISIIAILASTIVPNFIGFDSEARATATRANLDTLRTRITLFRAKEGQYPTDLQELLDTKYEDVGVEKPYLDKMPSELISEKSGNNEFTNILSTNEPISRNGGWVYYTDTAKVCVNINEALDKKWGEYAQEKPIDW